MVARPEQTDLVREFVRGTLADESLSVLEAVGRAQALARSVEEALAMTVAKARDAGSTWAEIGQVLGTSRQAAFQRFGRPADPRTGQPMVPAVPDAGERAEWLLADLTAGRWAQVCGQFGPAVAARLDADGLAGAWAQVIGLVGSYERHQAPTVFQAGDLTFADTMLEFEAGEQRMRVGYDRDGRVAGLTFQSGDTAAATPPRRPADEDHANQ